MSISMSELAQAREFVSSVLDDLQLDAYLFEIEPQEVRWEVKIECAVSEGWETVRLSVEKDLLLRGSEDPETRRALTSDWREALSACKRRTD